MPSADEVPDLLRGPARLPLTTQSPTYTATDTLEWSSPFARFWYRGEVAYVQLPERNNLLGL